MRLCLNMIVKNELANLPRCLTAIAPHITSWVILDTGSTDETQDFIRKFFEERNIPGEMYELPFENFRDSRNRALSLAEYSPFEFEFILLADADMELVATKASWPPSLTENAYTLLQRSSVTYWNTRLVRRCIGAQYISPTHEYLSVPGNTLKLEGPWFKDHESGSNRPEKSARDVALLSAEINKDPRSWYYAAVAYEGMGKLVDAAETYHQRAKMPGFPEEQWQAKLYEARIYQRLGKSAEFVLTALEAHQMRPWRAEAYYSLASYFRGMPEVSAIFCEAGLAIPWPKDDLLFVEDMVYKWGLREEYSIVANYSSDPARKARGHDACDFLALSRQVPAATRDLAWSNLFFYAEPFKSMCPSFTSRPVDFVPPDIFHNANPSVTRFGERLFMCERTVNYTYTDGGVYTMIPPSQFGLADLFRKYGTDKLTNGYTELYERLWGATREDVKAMLEVGIGTMIPDAPSSMVGYAQEGYKPGGSLRAWRDFFPNATICGMDIQEDTKIVDDDRIWTFMADSTNPYAFSLCDTTFDIVLDDGSHAVEDQIATLRNLWSFVADGGTYVVEDVTPGSWTSLAAVLPDIIGGTPHFFYGPQTNRLVIMKRPPDEVMGFSIDYSNAIVTRNYLCELDLDLNVISSVEIHRPSNWPEMLYKMVVGLEDMRLFVKNDELWCVFNCREINAEGWCQMVQGRLSLDGIISDWKILKSSMDQRNEKNWMPVGETGDYIYWCDPVRIVDDEGHVKTITVPSIKADGFRGGSQAISFDGGWLAVIHISRMRAEGPRYRHRFVWFDANWQLRATSHEFYWKEKVQEFCAGMAWHPDGERIVLSTALQDRESSIGTVSAIDIRRILNHIPAGTGGEPIEGNAKVRAWVESETNRALHSQSQIEDACQTLMLAGLPMHITRPKNWDTLIAVHHALTSVTNKDAPILDAGAGKDSAFLPGLAVLGYKSLRGMNLSFSDIEIIDGIRYVHGDITDTHYGDDGFAFIACQSVLEHGVDVHKFLSEAARILRPGGHLFISIDYWPEPRGNGLLTVFSQERVLDMLRFATECGLEVTGQAPEFTCLPIIKWAGLEYSFANLLFCRQDR